MPYLLIDRVQKPTVDTQMKLKLTKNWQQKEITAHREKSWEKPNQAVTMPPFTVHVGKLVSQYSSKMSSV